MYVFPFALVTVITVFQIVFRTLPDQEISSLALGGSIGRKDRVSLAKYDPMLDQFIFL